MHTLELTHSEAIDLLSALAAVTPSGGGGRLNSLGMKLTDMTGLNPDFSEAVAMQRTACNELKEGEGW